MEGDRQAQEKARSPDRALPRARRAGNTAGTGDEAAALVNRGAARSILDSGTTSASGKQINLWHISHFAEPAEPVIIHFAFCAPARRSATTEEAGRFRPALRCCREGGATCSSAIRRTSMVARTTFALSEPVPLALSWPWSLPGTAWR